MNYKKELLRSLWVGCRDLGSRISRAEGCRVQGLGFREMKGFRVEGSIGVEGFRV